MESAANTRSFKYVLHKRRFALAFRMIAAAILVVCSANAIIAAQEVSVGELPFKNNHERNLLYASQLYDAGEREEALEVYNNMIAAYQSVEQKEYEADVHEKLAYLFYGKDKQWQSEERFVEEQKTWERSRNIKTVEELTEFLRCMEKVDLTERPKDNSRYDRNFLLIITCFEENQAWTEALDWMDKYESFRNPESAVVTSTGSEETTEDSRSGYNDRIDLIKFKKAEYNLALKNYPEALKLYRQVAFGFNKEEQNKFAAQALEKYDELQNQLRPELYRKLISKARAAEKSGDWEAALNTLIYAKRFASNSGTHKRLIDAFKGRRRALLEKQLVTVNNALAKQQWTIGRTALSDCLKLAGDRPGLFSLYRACLLAERAEKLAEESKYDAAAEILLDAATLAENKTPFQQRAAEYVAKASSDTDAKLAEARDLIAEGGLENISSAYEIISQTLESDPESAEALLLRDELIGKAVTVELGGGVEIEFVLIPSGEFVMGSPENEKGRDKNEGVQRTVKLTNSFWMAATEITREQYESVMGDNSGEFQGAQNAVEISWNDAVSFCRTLSRHTGIGFNVRLPSEAEWEYACRAGTNTCFGFGDDERRLGDYAWFRANASDVNEQYVHSVAQKKPNPWGLYDMHGNMWEWCSDYYAVNDRSSEPVKDPKGPSEGEYRVLRGGSWFSTAKDCRSASRYWLSPDSSDNIVGFRVVLDMKHADKSIEDSEED
jgi:formylglycine-generating enzyme required for sulfatase activity